jgi:hypothetical protein
MCVWCETAACADLLTKSLGSRFLERFNILHFLRESTQRSKTTPKIPVESKTCYGACACVLSHISHDSANRLTRSVTLSTFPILRDQYCGPTPLVAEHRRSLAIASRCRDSTRRAVELGYMFEAGFLTLQSRPAAAQSLSRRRECYYELDSWSCHIVNHGRSAALCSGVACRLSFVFQASRFGSSAGGSL